MKKQVNFLMMVTLCLSSVLLSTSCKKNTLINEEATPEQSEGLRKTLNTPENIAVNWNNWTDGIKYTVAMATSDFGHINLFSQAEQDRTLISLSRLRVTLLKNSTGSPGGVITYSDVNSNEGYELKYKMRFASNFNFATAGYFGFGLGIGDGLLAAPQGEGAGFRLRWAKAANGDDYIHPYLNYVDQNGPEDNDFGVRFPATGSIQKNVFYDIRIVFKANTKMNKNGRAELYVNNIQVLNVPIRWTKDHNKRKANRIIFENYRVGSASSIDEHMWFDDFSLISNTPTYPATWCDNRYTHAKLFDPASATYYDLTTINTTGVTLRSSLANSVNGETGTEFARRVDCCVAFNGSQGIPDPPVGETYPIGIQIIDGNIIQQLATNHHTLGIKAGNQLLSYTPGTTATTIKNDGAVFALSAFQPFIVNHQPISLPPNGSDHRAKQPRQVIAQYDNGNIVVLSCGGRGYGGEGMTYPELTSILMALNVKFAFNLDGGGSTTTMLNGVRVTPLIDGNGTEERSRPQWLYIKNQ